jgi:hypothetical protein
MPSRLPSFLSPGEPDEAVHYVAEHRPAWEHTPSALDWLRMDVPATKKPAGTRRRAKLGD